MLKAESWKSHAGLKNWKSENRIHNLKLWKECHQAAIRIKDGKLKNRIHITKKETLKAEDGNSSKREKRGAKIGNKYRNSIWPQKYTYSYLIWNKKSSVSTRDPTAQLSLRKHLSSAIVFLRRDSRIQEDGDKLFQRSPYFLFNCCNIREGHMPSCPTGWVSSYSNSCCIGNNCNGPSSPNSNRSLRNTSVMLTVYLLMATWMIVFM